MKTNKNSATEDQVGELHKLVTKGYTLLTARMIKTYEEKLKEAEDTGDYSELAFIMDSRDLNAAGKWVALNDMGSLPATEDGDTELGKQLKDLKEKHANKVIQFVTKAVNE